MPVWEQRISPVFDTARSLMIFDSSSDAELKSMVIPFGECGFFRRIEILTEHDVKLLICGAISRVMLDHLLRNRIQVIPWITGDVNEVLAAYEQGLLSHPRFMMPGCRCRRGYRASKKS